MVRPSKRALWRSLLLLLAGCRSGADLQGPRATTAQIPLWSMPYGCNGGFQRRTHEISVTGSGSWSDTNYTRTTLDLSNGRLLQISESGQCSARPKDTVVDISDGTPRPLRESSFRSLTPSGFDAVVVTGKYLFAKETYYGSDDLPYVQSVMAEWSSSIGPAGVSFGRQTEKGSQYKPPPPRSSSAMPTAQQHLHRKQRVHRTLRDFYSAIRRGDTPKAMRLLPAWKRTPLYDLDGVYSLHPRCQKRQNQSSGTTARGRTFPQHPFSTWAHLL